MKNKLAKSGIVTALAALALVAAQGCSKTETTAEEVKPWDKLPMSMYLAWNSLPDSDFISRIDFANFDNVYFMDRDRWKSQEEFDNTIDDIIASDGKTMPSCNKNLYKYAIAQAHEAGTTALLCMTSDMAYGACDSIRRPKLVKALTLAVEDFGADGIDIDWESDLYNHNLVNHTLLMEGLRESLDSLGKANNRKYYLTTALSPEGSYYPDELRIRMGEAVDWINVMSYDIGGGIWEDSALHNTPLKIIADSMTNYWGVIPPEKLHLGLASYGFKYTNLLPGEPHPADRRMTDYARYAVYDELLPLIFHNDQWRHEYDSIQKQYYFINDAEHGFITCETPETVVHKFIYADEAGFGGTFWWEYSKDIAPDNNGGDKWMHILVPKHTRRESYK